MEQENNKQMEHIRKVVSPIFNRAIEKAMEKGITPKATFSNPVLVGGEETNNFSETVFGYWNPHNQRRTFDFSKVNFAFKKPKNKQKIKTNVGFPYSDIMTYLPFSWNYDYKPVNWGKEHLYMNFLQCNIRVRKNTIEITNKAYDHKKWVKIEAYNQQDIDNRIDQLTNEIEEHCRNALRLFIKIHGGKSNFKLIGSKGGIHGEDSVKDSEFTKNINPNMIIHDTVMKKVYNEKKVEFYTGKMDMKTYFKNVALHRFAPEIALELNKLVEISKNTVISINKLGDIQSKAFEGNRLLYEENKKVMVALQAQIKSHLALIQEYRKESIENRKPFFVRWWHYFRK